MNTLSFIEQSLKEAQKALNAFVSDKDQIKTLDEVAAKLSETFRSGNKCIIFGNGGSSADAAHFAEEFTGRYRKNRPALPVIVLNEGAHLTCVANDFGFDHVFLRGVEAFAKPKDMVIGISTSGNSKNVLLAMTKAQELGATTVAMLGRDGGLMRGKFDFEWLVQGATTDRIQEVQMMVLHIVIEMVERRLYPELY